jgi:lauroyl/myristoyl acyltransferase
VKTSVVSAAHELRRLIPPSVARAYVRRRVDKLWTIDAYRELQEAQMRHVLEFTDRAPEIPVLARRFAEESMLKTHLRWHPRLVTNEPVRGIEWLTTKRDLNRPVILNFMHHYRYEGMFKALKRQGVDLTIVAHAELMGKGTPNPLKHHMKLVASGGRMVPAGGGTDKYIAMAKPGVILVVASDLPGQTPVTFLGRRVIGSFGSARIATETNSPVVLVTAHQDEGGSYLQVHPPIEPGDFEDAHALLAKILEKHGEAVLAWPEVLDMPRARFGLIEEPDQ